MSNINKLHQQIKAQLSKGPNTTFRDGAFFAKVVEVELIKDDILVIVLSTGTMIYKLYVTDVSAAYIQKTAHHIFSLKKKFQFTVDEVSEHYKMTPREIRRVYNIG